MKAFASFFHILTLFCIAAFPVSTSFAETLENYTFKLNQSTSSYQLWTTPPSERVFQDTSPPAVSAGEIKVYTAKNEFEPFQIVIKPGASGNVAVNIGSFGSGITTEIYQAKYVNITQTIDNLGKTGNYPDPLWPVENGSSISLTANMNTAFWFSLYGPKTATAGDHFANVQIGGISIPIRFHVFNFAIPDELHVKSQMNYSHENFLTKYSVPGTASEYWMYVDKIKQFFIDHRRHLQALCGLDG
jgi:hypothetical protein